MQHRWRFTTVTYHDFARTYHGLISSYITLLTYFCVHGTVPTFTHCTASAMVGRGSVGHHISFPRVQHLASSGVISLKSWGVHSLFFLSPPSPPFFFPFSFPLFPSLLFVFLPFLSLRSRRPFNPARRSGERCNRAPAEIKFGASLALKCDISWKQFEWLSWKSVDQISCSLQSKCIQQLLTNQ